LLHAKITVGEEEILGEVSSNGLITPASADETNTTCVRSFSGMVIGWKTPGTINK
jgi:hypothetical protein